MAETRHGLQVQAQRAIAENTYWIQFLTALKAKEDEDGNIPPLTVSDVESLVIKLDSANKVIHKQANKIHGMAQTINDLQK